jgi:hypothetical protein
MSKLMQQSVVLPDSPERVYDMYLDRARASAEEVA